MSTPGAPFDPSLPRGFGERDPAFRPAELFANQRTPASAIYGCLFDTYQAWNGMDVHLNKLDRAAKRLQALSEGARHRDIVDAREALSRAVYQVVRARAEAEDGYYQGLVYVRAITGR